MLPPDDRPWRRAWRSGLTTWGAAAGTYLLLNAVFWTVSGRRAPGTEDFFGVWNRWDTGHYVEIATNGYNINSENPAFFPLYPLLIRWTDPILPGHKLGAALIVASLACIAALAVIHRLVEDIFDTATAQRTSLYLMAWPFAFFLVAAYNESLLLALCAASLYFMRRGQWWWAGALAGLASATRQAGVLLAFAFIVEYLRQRQGNFRKIRSDVLAILLVPSGLIAFMIYNAEALGDPLKFMHIQGFWGREFGPPWQGIVDTLDQIAARIDAGGPLATYAVLNIIDLVSVPLILLLLVLSVAGPWKLGPESWYLVAFGAAIFVMVLLPPMGRGLPPLHGLPRYALEMVPIFIVLGRLGESRGFERAYLFPAIGLQAALLIGYFANVWLA